MNRLSGQPNSGGPEREDQVASAYLKPSSEKTPREDVGVQGSHTLSHTQRERIQTQHMERGAGLSLLPLPFCLSRFHPPFQTSLASPNSLPCGCLEPDPWAGTLALKMTSDKLFKLLCLRFLVQKMKIIII